MGVVYKARDRQLDRVVALRLLPVAKVADAGQPAAVRPGSAQAASALSVIPTSSRIYGIDEVDGNRTSLPVELIAGAPLERLIPGGGCRSRPRSAMPCRLPTLLRRPMPRVSCIAT